MSLIGKMSEPLIDGHDKKVHLSGVFLCNLLFSINS